MYYKITSISNWSCYADRSIGIEYKIGEWVRPKINGSKLFIFDSIDSVRRYLFGSAKRCIVYECEAESPFYINAAIPIATLSHDFRQYWINYDEIISKKSAPTGTILCDAVMLTKQISI